MKSKMCRKVFSILFLLVFGFTATLAQERYVRPVDEGARDASFAAFREKTLTAANKRDVNYILSILDRNIKLSFGDLTGVEDFKRVWKINSPRSEFWDEFVTVLSNGGTFYNEDGAKTKLFQAPYTFSRFPNDLDAFEHQAIFGSNVNLRSKPQTEAPVIANLSYNVVKVDFENSIKNKAKENDYLWLKIETLGGKRGFVQAKYIRSPIDYRAIFEKKNGRWKLVTFIAGD